MSKDYDQIKKYIEADVNPDVRLLISDFAILWNNYEKYLFSDFNGNPFYRFSKLINSENNSRSVIDRIMNAMTPEYETEILNLYDKFIDYFKRKHGTFNARLFIDKYSVRKGDISEEELNDLIENQSLKNKYLFLMLMVGRVRNNMFHGIKQISDLNNQKELFEICNRLLTLSLDITNTLVF